MSNGSTLSAGHGTDAHPAQEQHVRHRRDQAERRRMGQPQGVQHPRAAARILMTNTTKQNE